MSQSLRQGTNAWDTYSEQLQTQMLFLRIEIYRSKKLLMRYLNCQIIERLDRLVTFNIAFGPTQCQDWIRFSHSILTDELTSHLTNGNLYAAETILKRHQVCHIIVLQVERAMADDQIRNIGINCHHNFFAQLQFIRKQQILICILLLCYFWLHVFMMSPNIDSRMCH